MRKHKRMWKNAEHQRTTNQKGKIQKEEKIATPVAINAALMVEIIATPVACNYRCIYNNATRVNECIYLQNFLNFMNACIQRSSKFIHLILFPNVSTNLYLLLIWLFKYIKIKIS